MVSFWPWKADETASFEKTLSTLSTKLQASNTKQNTLRTRSRRYKVLWTLYSLFAYILYSIILIFVTGRENWRLGEYAAVLGGPVAIFAVRYLLALYYDYRLSSLQAHIDDLQTQKDTAIEKFKAATKYDSTQQLLEKYGAATPQGSPKGSPATGKGKGGSAKKAEPKDKGGWTNVPPPPTANIKRPGADKPLPPAPSPAGPPSPAQDPTASFAPNAFPSPPSSPASPTSPTAPQYTHEHLEGGANWYDRILDLLLGEDETKASNRLVLICTHCRLVNGQAPPGVKTLEEVGRWRCGGCKGWNGVSEVERIVGEVGAGASPANEKQVDGAMKEEDEAQEESVTVEGTPEMKEEVHDETPVTRSRTKRVSDGE